jgi:hypothetical protein
LTFTFAKCLQMSLWMQVQFMLATSKLKTDRAVDSGELIQTLGLLEAVLWSVLWHYCLMYFFCLFPLHFSPSVFILSHYTLQYNLNYRKQQVVSCLWEEALASNRL